MYECGRRTSGWIGLIPDVHCRDKTAVHSEYVQNLAVRKNIPLKALDELVHPDASQSSATYISSPTRFSPPTPMKRGSDGTSSPNGDFDRLEAEAVELLIYENHTFNRLPPIPIIPIMI